jgi:MYXO-CTERM domain-containing protein
MPARTLILCLLTATTAATTAAPDSAARTRRRGVRAGRHAKQRPAPRPKPLLRRAVPDERQQRYRILGGLTNPDSQLRADAAWQAGQRRLMLAYKRLRQLLRDRDPLVRRNAAYALGMLGNREAAIALVDRVPRETVPDVMVQLAIALGRLKHKSTRGFLVGLLFRQDAALRAAGITALGYLGDPADVYTLGRFLRSKDAGERLATATALGHLGSRLAIRPLLGCLADPSPAVQSAVVESLAKLRAVVAIGAMVKLLPDALPPVALATIRALARLDALAARDALYRLVTTHSDGRLAAEAALAVAHLGGRLPAARLLTLLASRANDVRIPATHAAGLGGVREAIPVLARLLAHPHPALRLACARALGRLAAHQAVPMLLARLREEHGPVRAACVRALGRIRAVNSLPVLAQLLRSVDAQVVAAAAAAVGEISRLDRRPVRPLAGQLALLMTVKRSDRVAQEGALAFARLRPRGHRKGFSRMLRLTLSRDPRVRARALLSLGLYGDRLASPAVLRLLGDDDVTVYSHAALAAGRLGLNKSYGALYTQLTETHAEAHPVARARILLAVALIDPSQQKEAARYLDRLLSIGPNTPAKAGLVSELAAVRGRWVLPILQRARRSPCYLVQAAARRALSIWPPAVKTPAAAPIVARSRRPKAVRGAPSMAAAADNPSLAGPFPTPKGRDKGCECTAGPPRSPAPLWLLVLVLLWRRSRRCRGTAP